MEMKHELLYHPDQTDVHLQQQQQQQLVKTEPQQHQQLHQVLQESNGLATVVANGLTASPFSVGTSVSAGGVVVPGGKRPRTAEDWTATTSPQSATGGGSLGLGGVGAGAPLTPSPGPPSHSYTGLSNGYSSPMSSGSYDPYSPNGKLDRNSK